MDPISHGLLGGITAQTFFGRQLGRWAGLIGLTAALLPDLDVVLVNPADPVFNFVYHRHITHSLFSIPILGLLGALPFFWTRVGREQRRIVFFAALVGGATHSLLDAATSYGTQLFLPFSNARVAWDWLPIIDLFLWPVMLAGFVGAMVWRMPSIATIALALVLAYTGVGIVHKHRALSAQAALAEARGHAMEAPRVMPSPGTLVLWRGVYRHDGEIHVDGFRTPYLRPTLASTGSSVPLSTVGDVLETSDDEHEIRRVYETFEWFADGYVAMIGDDPPVIADLRYGGGLEGVSSLWGIAFESDGPARWRSRGENDESARGGYASELWSLLRHGDPRFVRVEEAVAAEVARLNNEDDPPAEEDDAAPVPAGS